MYKYFFWALVDKGGDYFGEIGQSGFLNFGSYCLEYFNQNGILLLDLDDFVLMHILLIENGLNKLL